MPTLEKKYFTKLYVAISMLVGVMITGVVGFMFVEGYSFPEACYMTVIVISTVGLSTIHELSPEGRVFISVLIMLSLVIVTYGLTITSSFILDGELKRVLKIRAVKQKIQSMSGHIIVTGYGRNGRQACEQLRRYNRNVVVIESKTDIADEMRNNTEVLFIEGDATRDEVLMEAGIMKAAALITTLPSDADNVFVVLTARGLNSGLKIISRASEDTSFIKIKRAGADNVIMPDKIGGTHMASLIAQPDVLEFVDMITGKSRFDLEEIDFKNCREAWIGKTLADLGLDGLNADNVIGMKNSDGEYRINPPMDTRLSAEIKIFVLGVSASVDALKRKIHVS